MVNLLHAIIPFTMFAIGYMYSEHRHASRIYSFTGLEIIHKYEHRPGEAATYRVQFSDDRLPWDMHLCPDYDPDFDEGMTVDGAYEDMGGCKSFSVHGTWFLPRRNHSLAERNFIDYRTGRVHFTGGINE